MRTVILFLFIITTSSFSQQPPGTEIYVADLTMKKGTLMMRQPVNITNRPGYENQPFFHPEQPLMYYASADETGRTDIIVYDLKTGKTKRVTNTSEREYSPTVTPDKKFISCIIQRDNGAQDLGKYPITGGDAEVMIDNLIVGYHAWMDDQNLLLFVLGQPNTLRWYSLRERTDKIIHENIGRSLHKIPGEQAVSFVDKQHAEWTIKKIKPDGSIDLICPTLPGREDLAWTADGKILMSDGEKLFYWQPGKSMAWMPVTAADTTSLRGITRLATNTKGSKIALVVNE
jgi:hypothetical protein